MNKVESIKVRQHVGQDRTLHIKVPSELVDKEVEVMIIYQPVEPVVDIVPLASLYGICADDPIVIDEEGISESLDDDLVGAFD